MKNILKNKKAPDRKCRVRTIFSVLTILGCLTAASATAFAYFGIQKGWGLGRIQGAYYEVGIQGVSGNDYLCGIAYEDSHSFVLSAEGTASAGYCKVTMDDTDYLTEQITPQAPLTLTVKAAAGTRITFTPQWGSVSTGDGTGKRYQNGETIEHSHTSFAEYTVAEGAELDQIAQHYGVSEEDILTFNNITGLIVGGTIRIPGVDPTAAPYEVPTDGEGAQSPVSGGDAETPVSGGDADSGNAETPVSGGDADSGNAQTPVSSGDAKEPVSGGDAV